jgi:hypothetical protein
MHKLRLIAAIFLGAALFLPRIGAQTADSCSKLVDLSIAGVDLEIEKAEHLPESTPAESPIGTRYKGIIPAHCRVEGVIESRVGANNVPYGIGFALAMPDDWNGRFLFQGGGGLNGTVQTPLGQQASGKEPALVRGFAVVSTDSGHKGAAFDGSFFADQEATLNFLYLAVGKVTVVAKQIVSFYYQRRADYSYFVGCSTGGREAMIMAQRYPRFFDGLIAGAPAMRTGYSNLGMRWVSVSLNQAAKRDEKGNLIPGSALSDNEKQLIVKSVLQACDGKDGLNDGMIFDIQDCNFDPAKLACTAEKTASCLTAKQINAVKRAMSGPRNSAGIQIYTGYLYDAGIGAGGRGLPGLLSGAPSPVDGPTPPTEQDVDAEAVAAATKPSALGDTRSWTNLSTFSGNGGRLLFYHGVSDPWFSALDTIGYYEDLISNNGGAEQVANWSRLFMIPGMGHCRGGEATLDQFDMLSALVDWVENGKAPDAIEASGDAFPGRSRPLCPYPQFAHYSGKGDPENASSFECRE